MKRYQAINGRVRRQARVWTHPVPGIAEQCWNRYTRGHLLVVDTMTRPARDSGSRLSATSSPARGGLASHLPPTTDAPAATRSPRSVDWRRRFCRPAVANVPDWLRRAVRLPLSFSAAAVAGHMPTLRRYAPQATLIFDTVDLHFCVSSAAE